MNPTRSTNPTAKRNSERSNTSDWAARCRSMASERWWVKIAPIESPSRSANEVVSATLITHLRKSGSGVSIVGSMVWT